MISADDLENNRVIWKEQSFLKPFRIPDGCAKCPSCNGSGKIRWRYSEPSPLNNPSQSDYWTCSLCLGKGYEKITTLEKMGYIMAKNGKMINCKQMGSCRNCAKIHGKRAK